MDKNSKASAAGNVYYWTMDKRTRNFGDFISAFLTINLFYPYNTKARGVHIIGSVIDDMFVPPPGEADQPVVFWGCGLRRPGGLSEDRRQNAHILSVRGPHSASELKLGHRIPIGDPGFLMPALYRPKPVAELKGRSICIPHFHDTRTDEAIRSLTGCDRIIRTNIEGTIEAFTDVIDAICAARFTLSSSLHGAVIAAAYGRPFAFWDAGEVDVPFKWDDFAASINIPVRFARDVEAGSSFYEEAIRDALDIPAMWPSLVRPPLPLRPAGLLSVLAYESELFSHKGNGVSLSGMLNRFRAAREHQETPIEDLFAEREALIGSAARANGLAHDLTVQRVTLTEREGELASARSECANLSDALASSERAAATAREEIAALRAERDGDRAALTEREGELASARSECANLSDALASSERAAATAREEIVALQTRLIEERSRFEADLGCAAEACIQLRASEESLQEMLSQVHRDREHIGQRLRAAEKEAGGRTAALFKLSSDLVLSEIRHQESDQIWESRQIDASRNLEHQIDCNNRDNVYLANQIKNLRNIVQVRSEIQKRKTLFSKNRKRRRSIERSGLFDQEFYCFRNPDVLSSGKDPFVHFIEFGLAEGRAPNALFDPAWYERRHPGAVQEAGSAFEHYLRYGMRQGYPPHPLFDAAWYRAAHADIAQSSGDPLRHYIEYGAKEGRNPNPFFDSGWYLEQYADVRESGLNPLAHFADFGEKAGRSPGPLFDVPWYKRQRRDATDDLTLTHYLEAGRFEGLSPHPFFDLAWYARIRPDAVAAGQSLAEHYLQYGEQEGSFPNPYFSPHWYRERYGDAAGVSPLLHFALHGVREGRDPGPDFSAQAYLQANPDVSAFPSGALGHYLAYGCREGRSLTPARPAVQTALPVPITPGERRVMIVDATYPTPDRDSGSVDAINFIRIFQRLDYRVYFCATANFETAALSDVAQQARLGLEALDVRVLDDRHGPSIAEIVRLNGGYFRLFFLSRVYCGGELYEHVRAHSPQSRIVFNTVDLHSLRELREASLNNERAGMLHAYRIGEREYYLSRMSDAAIVVSDEEARLLAERAPGGNVFTVPLIRDIPGRTLPFPQRTGIGFIGGFRHAPNIDAVRYFLDEIWPLVRAELPDVSFSLMGADVPAELAERSDPGLTIVGQVDDLASAFGRLRVTVAPLRYGAGAKGKVVTSLSHGVPCIVTPIAAEGMGVGEASAVLIASNPQDFAAEIVRAYTDPDLWNELSDLGLGLMRERYAFEAGINNIEKILSSISMPAEWAN